MYTHNIPEVHFIIAPVLWKFCGNSERYMMSPGYTNSKCPSQDLKASSGTSLLVQWLRLHALNAGGTGSVSGRGTKIPHASWPKTNK